MIFLLDLPASLLALSVSNILRLRTDYVLLVVGTIWWLGLGILISKVFRLFLAKPEKGTSST